MSPEFTGLYPAGEGAGNSGGLSGVLACIRRSESGGGRSNAHAGNTIACRRISRERNAPRGGKASRATGNVNRWTGKPACEARVDAAKLPHLA